jgi:hypothetical protein
MAASRVEAAEAPVAPFARDRAAVPFGWPAARPSVGLSLGSEWLLAAAAFRAVAAAEV